MQPRIADNYVPPVYAELGCFGGTPGTGTWPAANRTIYVPCIFPYPCTIYSLTFVNSSGTTQHYDIGFYDGYSKTKVSSTGSTLLSTIGPHTLTFASPLRVDVGRVYYAGLSLDSATPAVWRGNTEIPGCIAVGMGQEAAFPLNSTMTPVTAAVAYVPLFVFGIR